MQPLTERPAPAYSRERAKEKETALLAEYTRTGQIVAVAVGAKPADDIGDDLMEADLPTSDNPESGKPASANASFDDPESLANAVFAALKRQDRAAYGLTLIEADDLVALSGLSPTNAAEREATLQKDASVVFQEFGVSNASEDRAGGVGAMVDVVGVEIGRPGTLEGKAPRGNQETVQYWGTTIKFKLRAWPTPAPEDTERIADFAVSLPRIFRLSSGQWRLASAPVLSPEFRAYLDAGIHLKPELTQPEHYSFPLSVGNFWRYEESADEVRGDQLGRLETRTLETVRDAVTEVEKYDGYRVVTLERTRKGKRETTSTFRYLLSARRLYTCDRYCASKGGDLGWVLSYMKQNTPILVLPLRPDLHWNKGGKLAKRDGRYGSARKSETMTVPAGEFADTLKVSARNGGRARFFKPGVGFVRLSRRKDGAMRHYDLVKYRILGAE